MTDPVRCRGCGAPPIDVGSFGRYKLSCPTYERRDPRTTSECIIPQGRISYHDWFDAVKAWNDANAEDAP